MNRFFAFLLSLSLAACRSGAPQTPHPIPAPATGAVQAPIVVLVSLDGWRHDYLERFRPPALSALAAQGVRAVGLIPQFPSKTFPNHYTLVTGLRLAHHGIVSNNMTAPDLPGRFAMANRDVIADPRWWGGEPIWNTVERQGKVAAAMFWPGSEAPINGRHPTFWMKFDDEMPRASRVSKVLEWLALPEGQKPSFLTLYFSDVDNAGHRFGPDSAEVREAAQNVDQAVGDLVSGVLRLGLDRRVNYIVVSDHGMAATSSDRVVRLDDYVDLNTVDVVDWSPVLGLSPKDGDVEALYRALKDKHPGLAVYRRAEIPEVYGLANHSRVSPVIGIADEGWSVSSSREIARWSEPGRRGPGGNHGYDARVKSMQGLFIAQGSGVQVGRTLPPFENIHVYNLMCSLLGIQPAKNDGDLKAIREVLR